MAATRRHCKGWMATSLMTALSLSGCMVGPDYKTPEAPVENSWLEASTAATQPGVDEREWWKTFNDPVLDDLVMMAYEQNLDLKVAGLRVLEARAQRGISAGEFFPQLQRLAGSYTRFNTSEEVANPLRDDDFNDHAIGADVFWEVDVWGRFRRGIEADDASLYASIMNYDDVLVSLISEVATAYVEIRSLDQRLAYAEENVRIQRETVEVVDVRFRNGEATDLDLQQAKSNLANTRSLIPRLHSLRRQTVYRLCQLLGMTPRNLDEQLGERRDVPSPWVDVDLGVPAELLRRRPDVRRAEREAASQSARIGVAVSELFPHFALSGTIGYQAEDIGKLFTSEAFFGAIGPSFRWNILNYGRITNAIRVEDARFEQLLTQYHNTVLRAASEVESSAAAYRYSQEEVALLSEGVDASSKAVELALVQYRGGEVDFIRVLDTQLFLADLQDRLASRRADVATNLITLHRALGGGWQIHPGREFVDSATAERMRERTNWGKVLQSEYPKGELIKPAKFERDVTGSEAIPNLPNE
jgi:NodT family efflux transporter outer membrane factor (OMF) lipoprotein